MSLRFSFLGSVSRGVYALTGILLLLLSACSLRAQTLREIASRSMQEGDYKDAIICYEKLLSLSKQVLKEDDLEVVIHRAELGDAYRAAARWEDAIGQLDYAWKHLRHDAEHKGRWKAEEGDLAVQYGEALGRACQGASRYNDAVMVFSYMVSDGETSKRDESELLQPCALLADTLLLQGKRAEADVYVQKAVAITERRHVDNSAVQATILSGLSNLYIRHGLYDKARPLATRALELTSSRKQPDLTFLATLQANLGIIFSKLGELDSAEKMLNGAKAFFSTGMTPDSEKFMPLQRCFSEIALKREQPDAALVLARDALRLCKLHFPDDHPEMARCLGQLGFCYIAVGDQASAVASLDLAVAIAEKSLGKDHPLSLELRRARVQSAEAKKEVKEPPAVADPK